MKEDQLKALLKENVQKLPSEHFNDRVLANMPLGEKKKQPFVANDEPLLIVLVTLIIGGACGLLLYQINGIAQYLFLIIITFVILLCFIICLNELTQRVINKKIQQS